MFGWTKERKKWYVIILLEDNRHKTSYLGQKRKGKDLNPGSAARSRSTEDEHPVFLTSTVKEAWGMRCLVYTYRQ